MKTLMIGDETYKKLTAIKGKKSFTELLSELADKKKGAKFEDIEMFFGIMGNDEALERQRFIARHRKKFKVRTYETLS